MENKIFDPVRKIYVAPRPEEKVRQYVIHWLKEKREVPYSLMSCEYPIPLNDKTFRADIVIFGNRLQPLVIVECKAPEVPISQKTAFQIGIYNSQLKVPYLIMTNGRIILIYKYDMDRQQYIEIHDLPKYKDL